MAFMTPYYSDAAFVRIESTHGEGTLVPQGYEDLQDGETVVETYVGKWFCHLSAPGYMDQTEWMGPYDTQDAARTALSEEYFVDPDTGDDLKSEDE